MSQIDDFLSGRRPQDEETSGSSIDAFLSGGQPQKKKRERRESQATAGDYARAIESGLAEGIVNLTGGVGTFIQAPAANTLSGVIGAAHLADRGITWLLNKAGVDAEVNPTLQDHARMASRFAAESRDAQANDPTNLLARAGRYLQEDSERAAREIKARDEATNPELIAQQQNMGQAEGFMDNLAAIKDNPLAFTRMLSRSAPDMALGVGVGATLHRAGAGLGTVSTAGTLAEAGSSAMQGRQGVYQAVMNLPMDVLMQSPRYQEILKEAGGDRAKARHILANELADQVPLLTGAGTAMGTVLMNRLFGGDSTAKTIAGAERMTAKEFGKRTLQDTVEEGVQGVPEDTVQYGATVQADPNQEYDPGGSLAQNLAAGLAMGAGGHGYGYVRDNMGRLRRSNPAAPAPDEGGSTPAFDGARPTFPPAPTVAAPAAPAAPAPTPADVAAPSATPADPTTRLAELEILSEQRDLTPAERKEAADLLTSLQDEQDATQGTEGDAPQAPAVEAPAAEGGDGAAVDGVPEEPAAPELEAAGITPGDDAGNGFRHGPVAGERYRVGVVDSVGGAVSLEKRLPAGTAATFYIGIDGGLIDGDTLNLSNSGSRARLWIPSDAAAAAQAQQILGEMGQLTLNDPKRADLKKQLKALVTGSGDENAAPTAQPTQPPTDFWSFAKSKGFTPAQIKIGTPEHAALKAEYDALKAGKPEPVLPPMQPAQDVNLQNRDRGRAASVVQMSEIARNPDYMRLGPSRTPDSGAPMVFAVGDQLNIEPQALGRQDVAVMSDGQRVPFRYAVVDSTQVNPSNFADGRQNPDFNSTTPGTIKALNNGRTAGVRAAHEMGTAGEYVAGMQADEAMHGIPADVIARTPNPMLVRVYSDAANTANMAAKSQGQGLGMSPTELARQDAPLMDASVLSVYQAGDITSAANRDFVRAFIGKLQAAGQDVAGMMTGDGQLSQDGRKRIQAALMQAAYGDVYLVEEMFDSTDTDIKAIGEALKAVAGQWANMRGSARLGAINPQTDITQNLIQAIGLIRKARRDGTMLYDLVNQPDLMTGETPDATTVGVLRMFYSGQYMTRAVGKGKLTKSLSDYVTAAMATSADPDMFGDVVTAGEILATINPITEGQSDAEAQPEEGRGQPAGSGDPGVGAGEARTAVGRQRAGESGPGATADRGSEPGQDAAHEAQQQVGQGDPRAEEGDGAAAARAGAGQQEGADGRAAPAEGRAGAADGQAVKAKKPKKAAKPKAEPAPAATQAAPAPASDAGKADPFAGNRLFTSDKVAAARERLRKKLSGSQLNSGIDPELLMDGMTIAGAYIESGVRNFTQYAARMIQDMGDGVKPYLLSFWEAARNYPGLDTKGMTSVEESKRLHEQMLAPEAKSLAAAQASPKIGAQERSHDDGQATAGAAGDGAQEQGAGSVQPDAGGRDAEGVSGGPDGRDAGGDQRGAAGRDRRPGERGEPDVRAGSARQDAGDQHGDEGGRGDRAGAGDGDDRGSVSRVGDNYRIQPGELKRAGSWRATAEQNVRIVELVKQLEREGRRPTPEEAALLTKFTGWGATEIANGIFPDRYGLYKDATWQALGERLKAALTPEEYAQARRTTQYAHYTSESVIRSIYDGLRRLGFAGGRVLEPGMGIGLFNGLMPADMAASSQYTGIEYDGITGAIAKLLYPQSNVIVGDYTKTALPRDFFDVAIGNPPFGSITITNDPEYKKHGFMLHDYFFAKTIDRVKPGGLVVFVTSKGTMDKANDRARKYLAERADLLGAVRLPQTAFKDNAGTEVVTDVLFLRKRMPGEKVRRTSAGAALYRTNERGEAVGQPVMEVNDWLGLAEVQTPQGPATINEYFAAHPEMVLGAHSLTGSMYRVNEYTVVPEPGVDLEQAFARAVANLPEGVYRPGVKNPVAAAAVARERDFNPTHKKEGGLYVAEDGRLMQVESGVGVELTHRRGADGKLIALKPNDKAFLKSWVGLRDALKQAQLDQLTDGDWEKSLKALAEAYDAFVAKHGNLLAYTTIERENEDGTVTVTKRFKNDPLLRLDVDGATAYSLEHIKETGEIVKAPVLYQRVLQKRREPEIKTTQDALFVSLNALGRLDLDDVARRAGMSRQEVIDALGTAIYEAPGEGWQTADEYLSGNVVRKLKEAEAAARADKRYQRNVEALLAVQPKPLGPTEITVRLGQNWIPPSDIEAFAREVLNEDIQVSYNPRLGTWIAEQNGSNYSEFNTPKMSAGAILGAVLNSRTIRVTYRDQDGKTHVDTEATEKANDVARKMREAFSRWIWTDTKRADRLVNYYNEHFNNIAPRRYDGSHLTLPGVSLRFNLYPHQKRAIWRMIQDGDTYLAHSVGAGKTFTMIAAGMEERRLGLSNKPMYVVPNHMLAQFAREFLELYPAANIMAADEQNFHTHNRRRFVAQAALNDPDAIIITHSAFSRIGMSDEFAERFIADQIEEWKRSLDETDQSDRITRKQIERRIEQLDRRLEARQNRGKKDQVMSFEEVGVDRLFVDESHEYRKLDFATNQGNIKGIDPAGSQRAMDLFMKVQYLRSKKPGRALVMASGTPITNTMGELFTVQRFFQPDQLAEDGLDTFDAWASQYGEVVSGFEQNAAGGYEVVSRFAKFQNVPELMRRVRSFMDILTSSSLGELVQRPAVKGGGREIVVTPEPDGYRAYQKKLEARINAIRQRKGPPKKGEDIILNVIADGRFSAIDMRFVDPSLPPDPKSKLNKALDDLIAAYFETKDYEYTTNGQVDPIKGSSLILFTDIGLGEQSAKSRGFDMKAWIEKRLTDAGIPREHIAFMRDYKEHAKKERLFADMREGKKRILIGGKDMETGVNVQKRLTHLFHLDAPWFPASVEQREGRIVRQGNQNKAVVIRAYATKGSYDSTMWGMNGRKARFIEQALNGDDSVRSLEDVSEASAFEMAAALVSGDERYLKLAGLKADVDRLQRLAHAHHDDQNKLRRDKHSAEASIEHNRKLVAELKEAVAKRTPIRAGEFAGKVGLATYDKRDEFSNALFERFKELTATATRGEETIGEIGGFPIKFYGGFTQGSGNHYATVEVGVPGDHEPLLAFPLYPDLAVGGIATRAANQVNSLDRLLSEAETKIERNQRRIEQISQRLGAPFPEQAELLEKMAEMKALEAELTAEKAAEGGQPVSAEAAAATVEAQANGDDAPMMRRGGSSGMPESMVRQIADTISARWLRAPSIVVVPDMQDMRVPEAARLEDARQRAAGATGVPRGFYHRGTVYLVADGLGSVRDVAEALFHEALGHYGLRAVFGSALDGILDQIAMARPDLMRPKAKEYGKDLKNLKQRREVAEEVLAELSQVRPDIGFVKRAIAAIRTWLRQNVPYFKDMALTDAEIINSFILPARNWVERGERAMRPGGKVAFLRAFHGTPHRGIQRFSTDFIGTGEGAQAYGWGLYFASRKEIAEHYRKKLSDAKSYDPSYWDGVSLPPDLSPAEYRELGALRQKLNANATRNGAPLTAEESARFRELKDKENARAAAIEAARPTGQLYEVEIPEDSEMLLWDKPLSEQSEGVRKALEKLDWIDPSVFAEYTGMQLYEGLVRDGMTFEGKQRGDAQRDASLTLKSVGIKGIKYLDGTSRGAGDGSYNYVIFSGDDVAIQQTFFSRSTLGNTPPTPPQNPNAWQKLKAKALELTSPDAIESLIYEYQDKNIDLKRLRDHIKELGGTITDLNDAYLGEELYHKRLAKRTQDFLSEEIKPLLADMRARGVDMPTLERYLHARHAPEANRVLAERNPNAQMIEAGKAKALAEVKALGVQLQRARARGTATKAIEQALEQARDELSRWNQAQAFKGTEDERLSLSGMSDAEAAAFMGGLPAGQKVHLEALAARVDAMQAKTLEALEKYGLMDKATLDAWRSTYQFYVPLHRDEAHPDAVSHPIGQGFSTKGDASKRRTGSNEKVTNILAHIAMQREAALTRGEKNRVAKKLYLMAAQNPDPEIWSVDKPPMMKTVDRETGFVRTMVDPTYRNKPNVVMVRIGGKDHAITFNERNPKAARMAQSIKGADVGDLNAFESIIGKATRWLASVNTQYNPIFGIINFARDVQAAILQLSTTPLKGQERAMAAYVPAALKGIYAEVRSRRKGQPRGTGQWAKLWEDMQDEGGTTGYRELFITPDEQVKALTKELNALERGKASEAAHAVVDWLSDYNETMENAVRLAAYKVALDQGMSKERAASLAKNLTVNFNRRGRQTARLGAYYAFLNAAIQGTTRMVETLRGPLGRKIMLGGVMLGAVNALIGMAMMGGDDGEEDNWEKIPDFVKERSLIVPLGREDYLAIPMPLGYHVLPNLGRKAVEMMMHDDPTKGVGSHIAEMLRITLDAFNPLGGSQNLAQMVTPTPFDPAVALMMNRDWTGRPIYREDMSGLDPTPGHTRTKDTASTPSKVVSEALNKITGGTDYQPGAISWTPDQIDYVIGQITGGLGRELMKVEQTLTAPLTGEELPPHKIPLAGRLYGNTRGPSGESEKFYENVRRLNGVEREIRGLARDGGDVAGYMAEEPLSALVGMGNAAENQIRKLRQYRAEVVRRAEPGYQDEVKRINEQMGGVMKLLNQEVRRAKKEAAEAP